MPPPTIVARLRQVLGRAFRETGQAIDRVGMWGITHANTKKTLGDPAYKYDDHLSRHRNQFPLLRRGAPEISDDVAYIAPCSTLIGTVRVGPGSSVWYGSVLRADRCNNGMGRSREAEEQWRALSQEKRSSQRDLSWDGTANGGGIYIGSDTNIQDGCVITAVEDHSVVGDFCTVGHGAHIHSATVEDYSLVGMGAILNPGSRLESQSFVAAGAVVGCGVTVPSGELWVGNPAKKLRSLTQPEMDRLKYQADEYVKQAIGQSHVMELGGNIADGSDSRECEEEPSELDEIQKDKHNIDTALEKEENQKEEDKRILQSATSQYCERVDSSQGEDAQEEEGTLKARAQ